MYTKPKKKRQRIAKACNFCRQRKAKCDGLSPCRNCREAEIEFCVYTDNTARSSKCERNEKNKSLEDRIEKVESLIQELSRQFKTRIPDIQNTSVNELNNYSHNPYETVAQEELELAMGSSKSEMIQSNLINNGVNNTKEYDPLNTEPHDKDELNFELFSGSQFNFCRLSNKFIKQLKYKLPRNEQELLVPLENMQITFSASVKSFENKWIDLINPTQRTQLFNEKFVSDSKFFTTLLEKYYEQNILASYICPLAEVLELFGINYINQTNGIMGRKLSESELLITNITLGMSIFAKIDEFKRSKLIKYLNAIHEEESILDGLKELQEECFSNSIFYFHRVLLLNDGIQTVKALILLIIYAELNISSSHIDNTLLCLAIRIAKDIGLQRYESFCKLPKHQVIIWQRLWLLLEHFDIEMAFRKGKAPIISILDDELDDKLLKIDNEDRVEWVLNSQHTFNFTYYTFTKQLTRIRSKTYKQIFDASFTSFKEMLNILDSLNEEMYNLTKLLYPDCRPLFPGVQNFDTKKILNWIESLKLENVQNFMSLTCHIGFFSHLIVLNTIPMCATFTNVVYGKNFDKYGIISTNCCKIILNIAGKINRRIVPQTYINTIIHHITSAFLCLLHKSVNCPWLLDTFENIGLLLNVSHDFFAKYLNEDFPKVQAKNSTLSKEKKLELLCIVALKVGIRIFDTKSSSNVLEGNTSFMRHVDNLKKQFPFIFGKKLKHEILSQLCEDEIKNNDSDNYNLTSHTKPELRPFASRINQPSSEGFSSADLHTASENFMKKDWMSPMIASNSHNAEEFGLWNEISNQPGIGGMTSLHNFFYESDFGI